MRDITDLLASIDAQAPLAQRHVWLIDLLDWIRGDSCSPERALARVQQLLDTLDAQPTLRQQWEDWWEVFAQTVDLTTLLADFGFAPRTAFVSELAARLRRKCLPTTPETIDAAELFELVFYHPDDAIWLAALDAKTLVRIGQLLHLPSYEPGLSLWQHEVLDAITYCASQIRTTGFAAELRLRMDTPALSTRPFHALAADADDLREAFIAQAKGRVGVGADVEAAAQQLRDRLEICRQATASVYEHLQEHGISIGLVFRLRQMRERIIRTRGLMDCLLGSNTDASALRLIGSMALLSHELSSVRALVASNSSLLAAKVAERSAETGEHYITRDKAQYREMLGKAAGGGAFISLTTVAKFILAGAAASAFWAGFLNSLNYAASFVAIQLLQWTVATKQPAMTAPAMAAKLKDVKEASAIDSFVDEVTHLVRSQIAAIFGNLALVVPCVMLISIAAQQLMGAPLINAEKARHVLTELNLWGPTFLFAAVTGVLLFCSSIIAGWVENWFVLYRMHSALRYNPRITRWLGLSRAARWADFWRTHISGFASNISLGFLLGLVPAFASFFGLGLEVRHVTLSAGQIAAAAVALGWNVVHAPALWWAMASLPVIAAANLGVSFYCAFRLALSANSVSGIDRGRIRRAIWQRLRQQPLAFVWPTNPVETSEHPTRCA